MLFEPKTQHFKKLKRFTHEVDDKSLHLNKHKPKLLSLNYT